MLRFYTAVQLATALTVTRALGHRVPVGALLTGAAVNGLTHLVIDRREPLLKDPGELHLMQARLLVAGLELREVYRLTA